MFNIKCKPRPSSIYTKNAVVKNILFLCIRHNIKVLKRLRTSLEFNLFLRTYRAQAQWQNGRNSIRTWKHTSALAWKFLFIIKVLMYCVPEIFCKHFNLFALKAQISFVNTDAARGLPAMLFLFKLFVYSTYNETYIYTYFIYM